MWWRRRRSDTDFAQEIETHLALEADARIADGVSPDEARAAARRTPHVRQHHADA